MSFPSSLLLHTFIPYLSAYMRCFYFVVFLPRVLLCHSTSFVVRATVWLWILKSFLYGNITTSLAVFNFNTFYSCNFHMELFTYSFCLISHPLYISMQFNDFNTSFDILRPVIHHSPLFISLIGDALTDSISETCEWLLKWSCLVHNRRLFTSFFAMACWSSINLDVDGHNLLALSSLLWNAIIIVMHTYQAGSIPPVIPRPLKVTSKDHRQFSKFLSLFPLFLPVWRFLPLFVLLPNGKTINIHILQKDALLALFGKIYGNSVCTY